MTLYKTKHDDIVVFKIFNNLNDSLMWAVISLNRGRRSRSSPQSNSKVSMSKYGCSFRSTAMFLL